ncbi:hypothetical protein SK803_26935 [Lentzea sp. BCCO 10_0856]|uniref:Uncharacterized protein n=1 Tax=Lentzea miocenica TaxID=3095431 RepID=A0ABU4T6S7_9PSEU|nr:hypothetical protein [Lentzea sp. BCCO 10_0856]MDX8033874.1 hypothetical protein [Lentzea sp. BCCO 10_0856]
MATLKLEPRKLRVSRDQRIEHPAISQIEAGRAEHTLQIQGALDLCSDQPYALRVHRPVAAKQKITDDVRANDLSSATPELLPMARRQHKLAFQGGEASHPQHTLEIVTRITTLRGQTKTGGSS